MRKELRLLAVLALAFVPAAGAEDEVGGRFDVHCDFSHSLPDDPIVFPGQPGASHMHDFFGFQRTNAYTTFEEQIAALEEDPIPTTCREGGEMSPPARNNSGYWTPAVYVSDGLTKVKLRPSHAHIYYRNHGNGNVELFPPGFVMIAGDPMAPPEEQRGKLSWWCGSRQESTFDRIPSDCTEHDTIRVSISFPTCWDGRLDSEDHRSHIVYAEDYSGRCPNSHPLKLGRIIIHITYQVKDSLGRRLNPDSDVLLLGGPGYDMPMTAMHADYKFGWDQARIDLLVTECLNGNRDCKRDPP